MPVCCFSLFISDASSILDLSVSDFAWDTKTDSGTEGTGVVKTEYGVVKTKSGTDETGVVKTEYRAVKTESDLTG